MAAKLTKWQFRDCDEVGSAIIGASSVFAQVSAGPFSGAVTRVEIGRLTAVRTTTSATTVNSSGINGKLAAFHLPLRWRGELTWSGEALPRPTLLFHRPGEEFVRRGTDLDGIAFGFDHAWLGAQLRALAGIDDDAEVPAVTTKVPLRPDVLSRLAAALESLFRPARWLANSVRNDRVMTRAAGFVRRLTLDALVAAIEPSVGLECRGLGDPSHIVRRAEECFERAGTNPVPLADLCRAAGVSARTLQYAFERACGASPTQYFKLRRLAAARAALRASEPVRGAVKVAAIEAGYMHFGRFSADYRSLFGEAPSETVAHRAAPNTQPSLLLRAVGK